MIDNHAHPFALEPDGFDLGRLRLDPSGPPVLWEELLRRRLAGYLGVSEPDVAAARAEAARDYRAFVSGLFADVGITDVVMDFGWPPGLEERAGDLAALSGAAIHPLLRIETVIDGALADGVPRGEILERCDAALATAAERGYVGLKTIIAYRTGLDIDPAAVEPAALGDDDPGAKALRDLVFRRMLRVAAETGLPVQVHTGLGDSDLRLGAANPLLLEDVLATPEGGAAPVVLLHGGHPFEDEAAWLAATRSNLYVDLSLTPIVNPLGLAERIRRLVDIAPVDRLLAGTDGHSVPELVWFGAHRLAEAWRAVAVALEEAGAGAGWVEDAGGAVLEGNARRLYGLPGV